MCIRIGYMIISIGIFVIGNEFIGQTNVDGGVRIWSYRNTAFHDENATLDLHVLQGNVNYVVPHFDKHHLADGSIFMDDNVRPHD